MIFHAFEICTENEYRCAVFDSKGQADKKFKRAIRETGEPESFAIGTVEADSKDLAFDKIGRGEWNYSAKL